MSYHFYYSFFNILLNRLHFLISFPPFSVVILILFFILILFIFLYNYRNFLFVLQFLNFIFKFILSIVKYYRKNYRHLIKKKSLGYSKLLRHNFLPVRWSVLLRLCTQTVDKEMAPSFEKIYSLAFTMDPIYSLANNSTYTYNVSRYRL